MLWFFLETINVNRKKIEFLFINNYVYNYEDADGETFGILYTTDNKEYNVYVDVIKELSWTINQDGDETLDLSN